MPWHGGTFLSAAIQAIVAAEVGHLEVAYDYFGETALIDLRDSAFNTRDGLHLASLAKLRRSALRDNHRRETARAPA